jgi:predicted RNA-binding Zn ribbon-like protein
MPTSRPHSDWKDGFLFLGNHLVLDFLNTRPIQNDMPLELLSDFNALLRWFRTAGLISSLASADLQQRWGDIRRARQAVEALRELRERLRIQVAAWTDGGPLHRAMIGELNRLLADHPMLTRLTARASHAATELWFAPQRPEDLFAPLAHSAAALFAGSDPARVRKCGHCVLYFLDTSKKGTRRWCSMRLCGNRLKVAAYAARWRQP